MITHFGELSKILNPLKKADLLRVFCFSFLSSKHCLRIALSERRGDVARGKERWKGTDADCTVQPTFLLHVSLVWGCLFHGGLFTFSFSYASVLLPLPASSFSCRSTFWELIPGDEEEIWIKCKNCLFRSSEYAGRRFSWNADFVLYMVFVYIWYSGSFLL